NHADTGNDDRGISIDSRYVLANPAVESPDPVTPILTAQLAVPTKAGATIIFVMAAHPLGPMQDWMARRRRGGLEALAKWASSMDAPVVLAGDLNVTPQSELFGQLLRQGHLFDTARGKFPPPTWLTPVPGLGLRLDHVLVSPDIEVAKRTVGADYGSGHLPLTVDLKIPSAE
ncbi:MAG: endonuclease/exonuclease/phosphatase family protein, partial [Alphaproteobacteria bacterium]